MDSIEKQEYYTLIVYQTEGSRQEMVELLKSYGTVNYNNKLSKVTIDTEGGREIYYFEKWSTSNHENFINRLLGIRVDFLKYLEGDYPEKVMNFLSTRLSRGNK